MCERAKQAGTRFIYLEVWKADDLTTVYNESRAMNRLSIRNLMLTEILHTIYPTLPIV